FDGAPTFGDRSSVVPEGKMIIGTPNEINGGTSVVLATDRHVHSDKKYISDICLFKHANPVADVDSHAQMLNEGPQAIWSEGVSTNLQLEHDTSSLPQFFQCEELRVRKAQSIHHRPVEGFTVPRFLTPRCLWQRLSQHCGCSIAVH